MNPVFALIDLSLEEPPSPVLNGDTFTIGFKPGCDLVLPGCDGCKNLKLTLKKDKNASKWKASLPSVQKEALLFVNSVYQSKKVAVDGVVVKNGDCVEVYLKNQNVVRGIFYESSVLGVRGSVSTDAGDGIRAIFAEMDRYEALDEISFKYRGLKAFVKAGLPLETLQLPLPKSAANCDWRRLCEAVASETRNLIIKIEHAEHAKNPVEQLRLHHWKKLESIVISYGYVPDDVAKTRDFVKTVLFDAFKKNCINPSNLVSLVMDQVNVDLADFEGIQFSKLKRFRVRFVYGIKNNPAGVRSFFLRMPSLEELSVIVTTVEGFGRREEDARFFREAPTQWGLKKVSVTLLSNFLPNDLNEAMADGKLANVTELHISGNPSKIRVPLPQVTKVSLTAMEVRDVPRDVSKLFPSATDVTLHAVQDILGENFTWRRRGFLETDMEWFKNLKSIDAYPSAGFPFHRVTNAEWIVANDENGWCKKDDEEKSEKFYKTSRRLRGLTKVRGFFLYNAIAPDLTFLADVEWDLEYLGLTSGLTPQLLDRVVVKFPKLRFLQVGYCGSTLWTSVAKLPNLVCLIVGRRHPEDILPADGDGVLRPMPAADGFEDFMQKKPYSLRFVEFYGYRLYCPYGGTNYKHYLGPDGERVVRAEEHRAMLDV